ncbi:DUF2971 domain-containing protein (plasmid) [Gordonia hongkongensis]|uniref:DUF2971 domain-containing protein n=1 Tax=Gordonia TaxID=2053 RepID=UPI0030D39DAD
MTDDDAATELPPVLYHYTDAAGLHGILGPGKGPFQVAFPDDDSKFRHQGDNNIYTNGKAALFRATDIRYMNDSLELVFGARIVSERMKQAAEEHAHPALASTFAEIAEAFEPTRVFEWPFRCFAVCFCGDGDLLSQWRGYAGGVGGYSIGFPREVLERYSYGIHPKAASNTFNIPSQATLVQVGYGEKVARERADALVSWVEHAFDNGGILLDPDGRPAYFAALATFREIAGIKHEAFQEEREWRLVSVSGVHMEVRTRPRASGVVPYMDVVVNGRLSGEHGPDYVSDAPLAEVVVGPTEMPDAQVGAVRDLLRSRGMWGFRDVPVVKSEAPFRG